MRKYLAIAAITMTTLVGVSCQSEIQETHPFCAELTTHSDTCIEVADPIAQTGYLVYGDGRQPVKINYWLDGTIEIH